MKTLIWGTGAYCKNKIHYLNDNYDVIGFIDREKKEFMGQITILPAEIKALQYEAIIIMSDYCSEILYDLVALNVDLRKIILGSQIKPLSQLELEFISDDNYLYITEQGQLKYHWHYGKKEILVEKHGDLQALVRFNTAAGNRDCVKSMQPFPVSRLFGYATGTPIDRYFIENFIKKNRSLIAGNILEIGDREYTKLYGAPGAVSYVLNYGQNVDEYEFKGDLQTGDGLASNFYDCMIITQTLNFIFDLRSVARQIISSLREGGTALITVAGICMISRSDYDRYGHYWNFTDLSLKRMFEELPCEITVETWGNPKIACGFLMGMSKEEFSQNDLDYQDRDYQINITAVVRKKKFETSPKWPK